MAVNQAAELDVTSGKRRRGARPLKYHRGGPVDLCLLSLLGNRCFRQVRDTVNSIGEFCVDNNLDGVITKGQLRSLSLGGSDLRTLWRHVGRAIDCGALLSRGDGTFELAHFLDFNYSAEEREEWLEARRAGGRERTARGRRRAAAGQDDGEPPTACPAEKVEGLENTEESDRCDAQRTRSSSSVLSSSLPPERANEHTVGGAKDNASAMPSNHVPSKKRHTPDKASPEDAVDYASWARRLAGGCASISASTNAGGGRPAHASTPEGRGSAPNIEHVAQAAAHTDAAGEPPLYKPARMPNQASTDCNLNDCAKAIKAMVKDPDRELADGLFRVMTGIKALTVELEYAVGGYLRQLAKAKRTEPIRDPVKYLAGIIVAQRCHHLRRLEDEPWYILPNCLSGLGEPANWILTVPRVSKRAKRTQELRAEKIWAAQEQSAAA